MIFRGALNIWDRAPRTFPAVVSVTPAPTHLGPWVNQRRKARAGPSPPPVFEIPTRNRFAPLRQTRPNAVIVGDSIVRNVRVASSKGKVRTHCFSGACVLDVAAQVSGILKKDERIGAVVLHVGTNDTRLWQTEVLNRDFSSLIETVRGRSPTAKIIVSGPLPTYRHGAEKLFHPDGLHPSSLGAELLSDNISKTLHSNPTRIYGDTRDPRSFLPLDGAQIFSNSRLLGLRLLLRPYRLHINP
ncbi:uncharacterized protein LOC128601135 isoform X1 [Ictalurus furcatus]|uniref:uncharacterized protein LOC128601135 isoform X1 n=1 Tax=Ictalurus furcatus TaxID=66913 RepID=UPI002350B2F8|nr:uncharacterized protein LOC128601135 isoform X1 [Ictalurus furcatus]